MSTGQSWHLLVTGSHQAFDDAVLWDNARGLFVASMSDSSCSQELPWQTVHRTSRVHT